MDTPTSPVVASVRDAIRHRGRGKVFTSKDFLDLGSRDAVDQAVRKRDERRDGFLRVIRKAMEQTLGDDADAVMKELTKQGLSRGLAKQAVESVAGGRFTIFALVDALTRLAQKAEYAGDRTVLDVQAAAVFALAA